MNHNPSESSEFDEISPQPHPWERQPGERLDRYRWFQIYLTLPRPRRLATVAQIVGLKPGSSLIPRAASDWNWKERAAASDSPDAGCLALWKEWRIQLLREAAYVARFTGLEDTNRALAGAAIGEMGQTRARRHLGSLFRHQQGLLRLIAPLLKTDELEMDEGWLEDRIDRRVDDIWWEEEQELMAGVWGPQTGDTEKDSGESSHQRLEDAPETCREGLHEPYAYDDDAGESGSWLQQPDESDKHYHWFLIYLSLTFWQSTEQVARMVKVVRHATLAKIARKWSWQDRAAAFEAHHAGQPLALSNLQDRLLQEKAFDSLLQGLVESTKAIGNAEIGRLSRVKARNMLAFLSRRQRSLLHKLWRRNDAAAREALVERRALLFAPLIEERAQHLARNPVIDEREAEIMELLWGGDEDDDEDRADD